MKIKKGGVSIYIDPFVLGILITLAFELVAIVAAALIFGKKKK